MLRARRGSALILVLLMTLAVAGLAVAAIFMSSSAGLLSRFYDREREFRLAAESATEVARSRLTRDLSLAIPDTGMRQLLAGYAVRDAAGAEIPRARVNVFAAVTGDTMGVFLPHVTLLAVAYDANGTRHVRRTDLRRESFSRYAIFADSFPSGSAHGPGLVAGRVHTNGMWRASASGNRYRDTVSAVGGFSGVGTYDIDSLVGVPPVRYPADSTFEWMHSLATTANLGFAPVSGGGRGTRLEFVTIDADGDGVLEEHEGFARVFDLASAVGVDTMRLRASPPILGANRYHSWDDPIIQNQCGAFYKSGGRWHFFPVSTHRAVYAGAVLTSAVYPSVNNGQMKQMAKYDYQAVERVLSQPTARCFPAGSPYLMPAERLTNTAGVVTGTNADVIPFGASPPPGGWPGNVPYGGSDTTFSTHVRTCTFPQSDEPPLWTCSGVRDLGSWRTFGGEPTSIPSTVRQAGELPYLWPLSPVLNAASRRVVSSSGPLFVSGVASGNVTLRVAGRVSIVDRLQLRNDPNSPDMAACTDQLGVVAVGDVLVVEGLTTRVRLVGESTPPKQVSAALGGEGRFTIQAHLMSLTGTVGAENADDTMGAGLAQLPCPNDGGLSTLTNGGCFALTGGAAMRRYSGLYATSTSNSGYRYFGAQDRCQSTDRRPPFFPLTNRYMEVRTLEIEPNLANTPAKIRALLMRLKGRAL